MKVGQCTYSVTGNPMITPSLFIWQNTYKQRTTFKHIALTRQHFSRMCNPRLPTASHGIQVSVGGGSSAVELEFEFII